MSYSTNLIASCPVTPNNFFNLKKANFTQISDFLNFFNWLNTFQTNNIDIATITLFDAITHHLSLSFFLLILCINLHSNLGSPKN